ncbi:MAG: class I SAM-dependent methyltransferase, partial [Ignavibacteriae bacterium]|nr:class I SAM-dependent methyltransferase [Ignavibacteriota bacterium]
MYKNKNIVNYFNTSASVREKWNKKNYYYHKLLGKYYSFYIPTGSRVLEIGCGTGDLLYNVNSLSGVGIDFSEEMIKIAHTKYPHLNFQVAGAEDFNIDENFDYIIISDLVGYLWDVQELFKNMRKVCNDKTRIIISSYNILWEPILKLSEFLGLKQKQPIQNWLSMKDIIGLLELEGFETVKIDRKILLPKRFPVFNFIYNNILA